MNNNIGPLKFTPRLKHTIWGGKKIMPFKNLDDTRDQVGESWEISGVEGKETTVQEGVFAGRNINSLVAEFKAELVGKANYERFGNVFPLLIKFIDAAQDLSIQVHPDDVNAQKLGFDRGKTEMWYVLETDETAQLFCGVTETMTGQTFRKHVAENTICGVLENHRVQNGDVFFIPAGTIHAIGKGTFLLEIQQTNDVTFRIYDYDRKDVNGQKRDLHIEEAAACADLKVGKQHRVDYIRRKNHGVNLVQCRYFTTSLYDLTDAVCIDLQALDSFVAMTCVEGSALLMDDVGNEVSFAVGETVLFPAITNSVQVVGKVKFLACYV